MIGKLEGTFGGTLPDGAVLLEVLGVGYAVRVPLAALAHLRSTKGKKAVFYIHTVVREDAIDLYGFSTLEELAFFKELMGVKGVGPKTALTILNVAEVKSLKRSIAAGDASVLTKVYGIGRKSAERIVVELRDKLAKEVSERSPDDTIGTSGDVEVIEALMALGYSAAESRSALKNIPKEEVGVRERLGAALKQLGKSGNA